MHNKHHTRDFLRESTRYGSITNNSFLMKMISQHTTKKTKDLFVNKSSIQCRLPPLVPKHDFKVISLTMVL